MSYGEYVAKLALRGLEPYRGQMLLLDNDIRRHIDLASKLIPGAD